MTEQEAIELLDSFYEMDEMYCAAQIGIKALEEIQQYRVLESRLSDMFGGNLPLSRYVDELELTLKEPDKPHPINAIILTYEDAAKWEAYKSIGTPEEYREAVEKQKAKKPKEYEDKFYGCPACGNVLLHKWEKYNTKLMDKKNGLPYCLGCGQKLDWGDEDYEQTKS